MVSAQDHHRPVLLQEAVDTHPQYFEAAERSLRALDQAGAN